jgi:hypothetical protein
MIFTEHGGSHEQPVQGGKAGQVRPLRVRVMTGEETRRAMCAHAIFRRGILCFSHLEY